MYLQTRGQEAGEGPVESDLIVSVENKPLSSQYCALAANGANSVMGCIKNSVANCLKVFVPAFVQPHLKYCVQFGAPQCKILECDQRGATQRLKQLEGMTYKEQVRIFGLFSLRKRSLRSDLVAVYNALKKRRRDGSVDVFIPLSSNRT